MTRRKNIADADVYHFLIINCLEERQLAWKVVQKTKPKEQYGSTKRFYTDIL